ncbi:hypothetical protein CC78DRAFT_576218 [Lojkania enalia]|uniref:Uncharacterized protein n=1 Tax=Lojkania enalia TaxID=147567 RepID=A0A9P4N6C9_9PLEO|nr:hypothetical protein CC78DRAFT_576218 [Didymosphaeria enalia]
MDCGARRDQGLERSRDCFNARVIHDNIPAIGFAQGRATIMQLGRAREGSRLRVGYGTLDGNEQCHVAAAPSSMAVLVLWHAIADFLNRKFVVWNQISKDASWHHRSLEISARNTSRQKTTSDHKVLQLLPSPLPPHAQTAYPLSAPSCLGHLHRH